MDDEVAMRKRVGSPGYVAPEIIMHKPYNEKVACSNETHVPRHLKSEELVKMFRLCSRSMRRVWLLISGLTCRLSRSFFGLVPEGDTF